MGYIRHHSIIVTGADYSNIPPMSDITLQDAHAKALEIFGEKQVTPLLPAVTNSYRTFLVAPDGSKERWETSDVGNDNREVFKAFLRTSKFRLEWVELVSYDEAGPPYVVDYAGKEGYEEQVQD